MDFPDENRIEESEKTEHYDEEGVKESRGIQTAREEVDYGRKRKDKREEVCDEACLIKLPAVEKSGSEVLLVRAVGREHYHNVYREKNQKSVERNGYDDIDEGRNQRKDNAEDIGEGVEKACEDYHKRKHRENSFLDSAEKRPEDFEFASPERISDYRKSARKRESREDDEDCRPERGILHISARERSRIVLYSEPIGSAGEEGFVGGKVSREVDARKSREIKQQYDTGKYEYEEYHIDDDELPGEVAVKVSEEFPRAEFVDFFLEMGASFAAENDFVVFFGFGFAG